MLPHGHDHRGETGLRRYLGLKRTVVINLLVLAVVLWGLAGEWLRSREMQKEIARLEAQAAEMERKNGELAAFGESSSSEAMLEREARLKLNLQRPGEEVVIVRESPAPAAQVAVAEGRKADSRSNPGKWWRYFFR